MSGRRFKSIVAAVLILTALALAVAIFQLKARQHPPLGPFPGPNPNVKFIMGARYVPGGQCRKLGTVLLRPGSSPQVLMMKGGLRIYYVGEWGQMSCARSADGQTFVSAPVRIDGETSTGMKVDPCVVPLPDGTFRLYYTYNPTMEDPGISERNEIHSAVSADGERWRKEEGWRLKGPRIVDPDAVRTARGAVRLFFTRNANSIESALSGDGLNFALEQGERISTGSVSSTVILPDGRWAMGYQAGWKGKPAAFIAFSRDGIDFTPLNGPVAVPGGRGAIDAWGVESPSMTRFPTGDFFLIYVSAPQGI